MKYFNVIAAVLLTLLYLTGYIPPTGKFNLWITIFLIPFAMIMNTLLPLVAVFMRKRSGWFYVVPMIVGIPYLLSTVGLKKYFQREGGNDHTFTLFSHNLANFTVKGGNGDGSSSALYNMVLHPETDIQCYQEFANYPWSAEGNVIRRLTELNRQFYFSMEPETDHMDYSRVGTLIVSKYPIIASGDILSGEAGFNRVSFVDVVIRTDTVRVINVHLHSMGLGRYDPRIRSELRDVGRATRTILGKLKEGVFERSKQAQELARFVEHSPYPVVCAGDFNDMPYAYTYRYLRKFMKNAFEESGSGFGFTYNGGTLRVLRIDNQFYRGRIRSTDLRTRYDIPYTDHFPLQGTYRLTDSR